LGKFRRRLIEAAREAQVIARRGRSIYSDLKKLDAYVITGDEYEDMPRHFLGWVLGSMLRKTLRGMGRDAEKRRTQRVLLLRPNWVDSIWPKPSPSTPNAPRRCR
jgi:hypothetical protein